MIINATSLGLNKEDNIGLNFKNINKKKLFYDVIYNPTETNFLRTIQVFPVRQNLLLLE